MSGTPDNANIWGDADVYVAFDLDADNPDTIDDEFGADWELVGLLNGDEGFPESRDEDVGDHYAWGGRYIRTHRKNFKLTRKFTALESNPVTDRLRWPGSTAGKIVIPSANRIEQVKVAFEVIDGDDRRRMIANKAEVTVDGDVTENETDISEVTFLVTVFPMTVDGVDDVLFERQDSTVFSS